MTPRLSILLPTYDGGRYLGEQVNSILTQTMRDFELLAIDDGSGDDTRERLAAFARADGRVRVLRSDGNRGQKRRLAELAAVARADLLSVADQDDVWAPAKLERLLDGIGDKGVAFGPSRIVDGEGRETGLTILDLLPPQPSADDRLVYLFKPMVSAHAAIVRRAYFSDLSLLRAHPFDWLQSLDAIFTRGVAYVPEAVTLHRLHGGNQSNAILGKLPNLWGRMAPQQQRLRYNLRGTARWMLTQRLEHLGCSPLVGPALNATFARAHALCAAAWFGIDRPMALSDPALAQALDALLAPLAGSDADLAIARKYIRRLARSAWAPLEVARQCADTMLGPRLGRRRRAAR